MSLRDYLTTLRRRWTVVLVTVLVCVVAAVAYTVASEPVYRAQSTSFVTMGASDGSGTLLQGSQFTLQRVKSYTDVIESPDVLEPVIAELGLDDSVGQLRARVEAVNPADTVLIDISASSDDPADAAAVANAVTVRFAEVIEQLETPRDGGASPVKVTLTVPAAEPTSPTSPRLSLNLVLALAAGFGLGAGLALLREQLDTSIRSAQEITALTSAGPLGMVSVDPQAARRPLVVLDPENVRAEAFRTIRTNLQFVDVDNPPRRFVVTSAVQGEGKSTTACNLALTLAQGGRRVCIVDADMRRPRVADLLEVEGAVGLSNVLAGQHDVDDVLMPWRDGMVTVLPAGTSPPNPSELLSSQHMSSLLARLSEEFDVLVIDSPPLLPVSDAMILAQATDGAVLVIRHGSTSREQATTAVAALETVGARLIGTVMTFVPKRRGLAYRAYKYEPDQPRRPWRGEGAQRAQPVTPQPGVAATPAQTVTPQRGAGRTRTAAPSVTPAVSRRTTTAQADPAHTVREQASQAHPEQASPIMQAQPETSYPETAYRRQANHGQVNHGSTGPASTAAEPMAAEPMAAEPMAAEPMAAEPMAAEPMVAGSVAAGSVAAGSAAPEPTMGPMHADPVIQALVPRADSLTRAQRAAAARRARVRRSERRLPMGRSPRSDDQEDPPGGGSPTLTAGVAPGATLDDLFPPATPRTAASETWELLPEHHEPAPGDGVLRGNQDVPDALVDDQGPPPFAPLRPSTSSPTGAPDQGHDDLTGPQDGTAQAAAVRGGEHLNGAAAGPQAPHPTPARNGRREARSETPDASLEWSQFVARGRQG